MNPKVDGFFRKAKKWHEEFEIENDHSWLSAERRIEVGLSLLHVSQRKHRFNAWI